MTFVVIYPEFLDVLLQKRFSDILSNIKSNKSFRDSI